MKNLMLLTIFITSLNNFSQNTDDKLGAWYMYGGSHKASEKWTAKSLIHFRFFETTKDLQQLLIRFGANYSFNKTFSATLGYAYLNTDGTYANDGGESNEHRIYQDFNINHKLTSLKFAHRFRLEQRFLAADNRHWIRYQIGLSHPISLKWSTYFFNEVFLNFQDKTFAQNWIGGGFTYKASNLLKLKIGYLNIFQNSKNFDRLLLGIVINTNHLKKNKLIK